MTTNTKVRVGLIGYGYWGPNLLRNLVSHPDATVVGVVEAQPAARAKCQALYPHIPVFAALDELLGKGGVEAMVIATPPATHADLAIRCLKAGAHVLVEKPLALSSADCDRILEAAERANRKVMVDHTFAYNPAVEYLANAIKRGEIGDLLYYDSVRVNLGGFQPTTNALWDLAPHDLSILDVFLAGKLPTEVSAVGIRHFGTTVENLCYLTLRYDNHFMAHINLNWIAPVKIRTITVGGTKKMAIYDDNLPTEKVKIYDKSVSLTFAGSESDFRVNYRTGDMTAPAIPATEALKGVISQFIDCAARGTQPSCDGAAGKRIVEILEAASLSIAEGGRPVRIGGAPVERRRQPKRSDAA